MSLRLGGAFVTRFNEALLAAGIRDQWWEHATHRQVEDLVDRLKYDLARVLLASPTVVVVATLDLDPLERALVERYENNCK